MLALDVGSSSVRAQEFDERGEPVGKLRHDAYRTTDANEICGIVRSLLDGAEPDGVSCFGHSLLAVDRSWRPLTPILGWRDTRSAAAAEWLRRRIDPVAVQARTGAYVHPSYWPAKLAWLAEAMPDVYRDAAHFVSFADFLRGEPTTSLSIASGTGLLDLAAGDWDDELLGVLGLEPDRLPEIADLPVWIDAACSNIGTGCTGHERAARSTVSRSPRRRSTSGRRLSRALRFASPRSQICCPT